MLVVGGRCCQDVLLERGIRQGRPESMDLIVLALSYCLGPLVQGWCGQGFCVDIDGKTLAAWAYADDLFMATGAAR